MLDNSLIVNLFRGVGSEKSTIAVDLVAELRKAGISCELIDEFKSEYTWENRSGKDFGKVFEAQVERLEQLNGNVDVIINETPLLATLAFQMTPKRFRRSVIAEFNNYTNLNYFIFKRVRKGESFENAIFEMLKWQQQGFARLLGTPQEPPKIVKVVRSKLKEVTQ